MATEIPIDDLARMSGDSVKFEKVGDFVVGIITQVTQPFDRVNKNNDRNETVYPIGLTPEGGTQVIIWPVKTESGASPMLQAIVEAVQKAGSNAYAIGGKLAVKFTEERDTGKPNKLKMFAAKYEPPTPAAASVTVPADDLF